MRKITELVKKKKSLFLEGKSIIWNGKNCFNLQCISYHFVVWSWEIQCQLEIKKKKRGNLYTNAVHHIRNRWRLLNNGEISSQILAKWVLTMNIRVFTFHEARDNPLLTQKSKEGKLNRLRASLPIFTFSLPARSRYFWVLTYSFVRMSVCC